MTEKELIEQLQRFYDYYVEEEIDCGKDIEFEQKAYIEIREIIKESALLKKRIEQLENDLREVCRLI